MSPTAPSPSPSATTAADAGTSSGSTAKATTKSTTKTTTTKTTTKAAAPTKPSGTFKGALVRTALGNFQMSITVKNGTITAVNTIVGGDNRSESVRINNYAIPTLKSKILSAHTWNVGNISGASYTSAGVEASVKSAMQAAGIS